MSTDLIPNLTDLFNIPSELEWRGKVYKLPKPTPLQTAKFTKHLENRAMDAITRNPAMEDRDRRELMGIVSSQVASGMYDWGGLLCFQALASPSGQGKIVEILLEGQLSELEAVEMASELHEVIALKIIQTIEADPKKKAALHSLLSLEKSLSSSSRIPRSTSRGRKSKTRRGK